MPSGRRVLLPAQNLTAAGIRTDFDTENHGESEAIHSKPDRAGPRINVGIRKINFVVGT
jgi:hypothetical protein